MVIWIFYSCIHVFLRQGEEVYVSGIVETGQAVHDREEVTPIRPPTIDVICQWLSANNQPQYRSISRLGYFQHLRFHFARSLRHFEYFYLSEEAQQ